MNFNPFKLFIKITYIIAFLVIIISCKNQVSEDQTTILNYKNNNIEYQVNESLSKMNSNDIEQCEKFLEYTTSDDGFEIGGATLGDLYSIIYNINPSKIELLDKKALFYSVVYKGEKDDAVLDDLFEQLLNRRNLEVSSFNKNVSLATLSLDGSEKIQQHLGTNLDESEIVYEEGGYVCKNVNLELFVKSLNGIYFNEFSFKDDLKNKYNLEIPLGKSKDDMIKYLEVAYGFKISNELSTIEIHQIAMKD